MEAMSQSVFLAIAVVVVFGGVTCVRGGVHGAGDEQPQPRGTTLVIDKLPKLFYMTGTHQDHFVHGVYKDSHDIVEVHELTVGNPLKTAGDRIQYRHAMNVENIHLEYRLKFKGFNQLTIEPGQHRLVTFNRQDKPWIVIKAIEIGLKADVPSDAPVGTVVKEGESALQLWAQIHTEEVEKIICLGQRIPRL